MLRTRGEPALRELETDALAAVLAADECAVIATGGGTVESAAARSMLAAQPIVVLLAAPSSDLVARLDGGDRPLLEGPSVAALDALARRRGPWYSEVATATVDASGPVADVVDAVARLVVRA